MKILSIIIVNWNVKTYLEACLHSIFKSPQGQSYEVFVVDNASSDGSADMVRMQFPQVQLIVNEANVGFPVANNQAIRQSTGQYILLLNPDTLVPDGTIEQMIAFLETHPTAGACGPKIFRPDGAMQLDCARRFPSLWTEFLYHTGLSLRYPSEPWLQRHLMGDWDHNDTRPIELLDGSCICIRRAVLDQIGLLDEDLFYAEDIDLCWRLVQARWELYFLHDVTLIHHGGRSSIQTPDRMMGQAQLALTQYFRKHYGSLYAYVYHLEMKLIPALRVLLLPITDFCYYNVFLVTWVRTIKKLFHGGRA